MKHIFLSLLLMIMTWLSGFAQHQSARLIVRVDDLGFSHSGNDAIIKTVNEGIATSIEVIVPSPWFPEAVELLKKHPSIDVGVHLALTSEWDNLKYRPVSYCPSLTDADGYFYPFIWPDPLYPGQNLLANHWKLEDIEKEFRAQIELALRKLPKVSHISAHMGCYNMAPEVKEMTKKLAAEYNIDIDPEDYHVKSVSYIGPKKTSKEKVQSFIKMLESLKPGETYLFVDHPGIDNHELRAIYHKGYEDVAIDRQGVTDALTSPEVRKVIRKRNIQLISYADLL